VNEVKKKHEYLLWILALTIRFCLLSLRCVKHFKKACSTLRLSTNRPQHQGNPQDIQETSRVPRGARATPSGVIAEGQRSAGNTAVTGQRPAAGLKPGPNETRRDERN